MNDRFGLKELGVGAFFALAGVVIVIVQGGLIGRLTKRFGEWKLAITGPALITIAMSLYVIVGWNPSITWSGGILVILFGGLFNASGRSVQTPTMSSLISKTSDPSMQGTVFGLYHMLGSLARVIGPVVATAVYSRHMAGPFLLAGAIALAVALWTAMLRLQTRFTPVV